MKLHMLRHHFPTLLLCIYNSVVNFYRFCLTSLRTLTSLSPNKAAWSIVLAVAATGCAVLDSRTPEQVVKERAQARWNALVSTDLKSAYEYLSPATRQSLRYEGFVIAYRQGFWKSATVDSVQCPKPDLCQVDVTIESEVKKGLKVKGPLRETWIREGNDWWYALKG